MKTTLWIAFIACLPLGAQDLGSHAKNKRPASPGLLQELRQDLISKSGIEKGAASARNIASDSCPIEDLLPDMPVTRAIVSSDCQFGDIVPGQNFPILTQQFRLQIGAKSTVTIEMNSPEFDTLLVLLDVNLRIFALNDDADASTANSRLVATLKRGTYFVLATTVSRGVTGSYTLQSAVREAPTCVLQDLPLGDSNGELDFSDCLVEQILPPSADARFGDGYLVTVTSRSVIVAQLQSSAFDAFLELYDSAGKKLASDDDSAGGTDALLTASVGPGTYRLIVSSLGEGATGPYAMRAAIADPKPCTRTDLPFRSVRTDSLGTDCRVLDLLVPGADTKVVRAYRLPITEPGVVLIDMASNVIDSFLYLLDANGKVVGSNDDADRTTFDAEILFSIPVGEYTVVATTSDGRGSGPYQIAAQFQRARACVTADLAVPGSANGSLTGNDCGNWDVIPFYGFPQLTKLYRIQMPRKAMLTLDMTSNQVDAYLILAGAGNQVIAENDDTATSTNASITVQLNPGSYSVLATSSSQNEVGSYTVRTSIADPPACPTFELGVNASVTDQITTSDCRVRELVVEEPAGVVGKQYTVTVTQDGSLTVDMGARTFTPALLLYDPQGKRIAADIRGTPGVAEVSAPVTAGVYTVVVTGTMGETGTFALRSAFE